MKKLGITFGTILLVLGCLAFSTTAKAARGAGQPTFTQIDVPGASFTAANSINDQGDIVGPYFDGDGNGHGFLLSNGAFTTIDVPGAIFTIATSINIQGQIVGLYFDSDGNGHGYLLSNGGFTSIDVPGAMFTIASGINAAGEIVGDYFDNSGLRHGYRLTNGAFTLIDLPGAGPFGTDLESINSSDQGRIQDNRCTRSCANLYN